MSKKTEKARKEWLAAFDKKRVGASTMQEAEELRMSEEQAWAIYTDAVTEHVQRRAKLPPELLDAFIAHRDLVVDQIKKHLPPEKHTLCNDLYATGAAITGIIVEEAIRKAYPENSANKIVKILAKSFRDRRQHD